MKNFKYIKSIFSLVLVTLLFTGCEEDLDSPLSNFVGFEIGAGSAIDIPMNETESIDVKVYASEVSSSDRTFNVVVDMEATTLMSPYSVPSQVTIPGGSNEGTITFTVTDDDNLSFVAQDLVFGFEGETSPQVTFSFSQECTDTVVTFNLTLDTWPDETTWELYDLNGGVTVIASGGPYDNPADDFAELSFDFCLTPGQYGVVVYDSYGDGGPTYSVTSSAGVLIPETAVAGTQSSAAFTVN